MFAWFNVLLVPFKTPAQMTSTFIRKLQCSLTKNEGGCIMGFSRQLSTALCVGTLLGCENAAAPTSPDAVGQFDVPTQNVVAGGSRRYVAKGVGTYLIESLDIPVDFRLDAVALPNGKARGHFTQSLVFQDLLIAFRGRVTCLTVDPQNGRAWVGAVVTENRSEHPGFTTEIHQSGKDVWFRVLDTGRGSGEADRSTFMGFEGAGGIITSEEYCEAKIWPGPPDDDENARTNPVTKGMILVAPNTN